MHHFEWTSFVPVPLERVWSFFSDPANLARLTPPEMRLTLAAASDAEVRAGTVIDLRLRLLGLPLRWTSRIEVWQPRERFVDVQLRGPYSHWRHEHVFRAAERGTWIMDRVAYAVPLGRMGRWVERLWVRRALGRIFFHRSVAVARLLTDRPVPPPTLDPAECRCA